MISTPRWRTLAHALAWFATGVLAMVFVVYARGLVHDDPSPLTGAEMVILTGADESIGGQRQALVDQWNRAHPSTPARLENLSTSSDAQHSEMVSRAQSDNPGIDIYNLDVTWTAEFATAGYIRALDETTDIAGFLGAPLHTCQFDSRLWALPFNTDAGLLYFRTSVPTNALPKTLPPQPNDVRALRTSQPGLQGGLVTPLAQYEGLTVSALEAIWSAGGEVYDAENNLVVIDSTKARAGLRQLAQGLRGTDGLPPAIAPRSREFREDTGRTAFRRGEAPLMRDWPVAYGQLRSGDKPLKDFDVRPLPGRSVLGGQNLAVAAGTRDPQVAQELVRYLTSEDSERQLFAQGGLAATRSAVYDDPEVRRKRPYAPVLLQALNEAKSRPDTPHYALFSSVFQEIVVETLNSGGELPDDAVTRLTDALHGRLG
ncbi:extracellular solute-binding protein [Actinoplanes sp. NPDC051470]|uniref:extracellular solute-binding protein n=1 Tax=unclassified Actinoplanes TaxID=2626549 RepID=UPI0034356657